MKKLKSKKGQISMEFVILFAGAIAVATVAGYYYLMSVESSSINAKNATIKVNSAINENVLKNVDDVEQVLNK